MAAQIRDRILSRRMAPLQYEPALRQQGCMTLPGDMPLPLLDIVNQVLGAEMRAEWNEECLNLEVSNFNMLKQACTLWKRTGWVSKRVALAANHRAEEKRAARYAPQIRSMRWIRSKKATSSNWLSYATPRQLQDVSTAWAVFCLQMRTPDACQGRQAKSPRSGCNGTLRSTKFSKFDDFPKNSFKSDVALKHEFTRYQSRKIIESVHKQNPRGGKKEAECRKSA